jgi:osmotically-inducible protein OsmY
MPCCKEFQAEKGVDAMTKLQMITATTFLGLAAAFGGAALRAQQDPPPEGAAARAGEKLDEVGRAIRRGLENAEDTVRDSLNKTGDSVREGFAKTRDTVQGMGLIPRVYGRLHWEKALHTSTFYVKAEGGTVTIRGQVPDEAAKAKAIALVRDTVGVTRVIAEIGVAAPSVSPTSVSKGTSGG